MSNNTVKLREALEKAKKAICHHAKYVCDSLAWENSNSQSSCADILCCQRDLCEAKTAINAALAAPPRNCDLYPDARSAREAWEKEGSRRAFSDWLLTAAGKD